jgi:hypothetical protein
MYVGRQNMLEKRLHALEKLGGVFAIAVAVSGLALVSVFQPPTFVQIICAFAGAFVCLVGVVFLFSEGSILEEHWSKKASKVK